MGENNPTVSLMLRLPVELHNRLKQAAEKDLRSLNAEAVILIQEALAWREAERELVARGRPDIIWKGPDGKFYIAEVKS